MRKDPTWVTWRNMIRRCSDPADKGFPNYGGRGIKVCLRWLSFDNFWDDMGDRPSDLHTLERIDYDGDYSPENCRWATRLEQGRNKRNNRRITFNGETLCLSEWAERLGIHSAALIKRLDEWPLERALTEYGKGNRLIELNGVQYTLSEASRKFGIHKNTLKKRLDHGWPVDVALGVKPNQAFNTGAKKQAKSELSFLLEKLDGQKESDEEEEQRQR